LLHKKKGFFGALQQAGLDASAHFIPQLPSHNRVKHSKTQAAMKPL